MAGSSIVNGSYRPNFSPGIKEAVISQKLSAVCFPFH
jgi:hypothetical protein